MSIILGLYLQFRQCGGHYPFQILLVGFLTKVQLHVEYYMGGTQGDHPFQHPFFDLYQTLNWLEGGSDREGA
jgi:hypothetical protein